jgi:hypothetical protein
MQICRVLCSLGLLAALIAVPAMADPPQTPLQLVVEGTLTRGTVVLPWPADPTLRLELGARVKANVTASSSSATAEADLVDYFQAATADEGFVLSSPTAGVIALGWQGQWTNRKGFLLQGAMTGGSTGVVSQTPPVIALAGAAEIHGLSGRGRGIVLSANWKGKLDTASGALHAELTGPAVGELGPPEVVCGDYTDEGLAGESQELMKRPDGSINQDHFGHDASDPYPHPFPYSTNPPTSGPHNPSPLPPGIYTTPQDDESLVHNLEHGHVIVTYLPSVAPSVVARLGALVDLYVEDVLLVPRPADDAPIALVSWGRLQKFQEYDEPAIQNFIDRNRGHGPECFH